MPSNQIYCTTARSCWRCCLFFSIYRLLMAAGTRHSRRSLFILPWFSKTRISISYEANGTRDFRHRSPAHLCNVYRTSGIGFMVHSSFESRSRLNGESGSGIRPRAFVYVGVAPRKTPFLSLIVSSGLVEMAKNSRPEKCCNIVRICMTNMYRSKFI